MAAPHRIRDAYDSFEDSPGDARMGLLEHLDELRSRLIRACIALVAGMAVSFRICTPAG
jgi:Sec-independent protein secretion pathway component TatC